MRLYNYSTKQFEDVNEAEVTQKIGSAQYGAVKGQDIPIVLQDGRKGIIPAEKAFEVFSRGEARFYTSEERKQDAIDKELSGFGGFALANSTAFLSGSTLGLSDQFLTKTSIVDESYLARARELWKATSFTSEMFGSIAPILFTGGAGTVPTAARIGAKGLAKRGIQTIGSPVNLAVNAGKQVEKVLAKQLGAKSVTEQAAQSILKTIAPRAVGSSVEGAAFATGQLISEEALGNTEFTAESVLTTLGGGALFGAGFGAVAGLPGALSSKALAKARLNAKKLGAEVDSLANKAENPDLYKQVADDQIKKIRSVKENSPYYDGDPTPYSDNEMLAATLSQLSPEEVRYYKKNPQAVDNALRKDQYSFLINDKLKILDNSLEEFEVASQELLAKNSTRFSFDFLFPYLDKRAKVLRRQDMQLGGKSPELEYIEELKDSLFTKEGTLKAKKFTPEQLRKTITNLRDSNVYRKRLGPNGVAPKGLKKENDLLAKYIREELGATIEGYDDLMAGYSSLLDVRERVGNLFKNVNKAGDIVDKELSKHLVQGAEGSVIAGKPDDLLTLFDFDAVTYRPGSSTIKDEYLNSVLSAKLNLDQVGRLGEDQAKNLFTIFVGSATGNLAIATANARIRFMQGIVGQTRMAAFRKLVQQEDSFLKSAIERLSFIEKARNGGLSKIKERAKNFAAKGQSLNTPRVGTAVATTGLFNFILENEPKNEKEAFAEFQKQMSELQSSPDALVNKLNTRVDPIRDIAPKVSDDLIRTSMVAFNYLANRLPKSNVINRLKTKQIEPNEFEFNQYKAELRAINQPFSVLDDLESGTITGRQVQALQFVYPNLYEEMKIAYMEEIAESERDLSYDEAISLSIFLQTPLETVLNPTNLLDLQRRLAATEGEDQDQTQQGSNIPRKSAIDSFEFKGRSQTNTDRIVERGVGE